MGLVRESALASHASLCCALVGVMMEIFSPDRLGHYLALFVMKNKRHCGMGGRMNPSTGAIFVAC